jgi:hypothetical protein
MENSTNKLTVEAAIQIINSRKLIPNVDGYYAVKVGNVTPFEDRFIANFDAMSPYHLNEAKTHLKNGEIDKAANFRFTASLRVKDYLPSKGEILEIYVSEVTTKKGITGRFVTAIKEIKAKNGASIQLSLEDIMSSIEETQKVSETKKEVSLEL